MFRERLKLLRRESGFSQKELAVMLSVSQQTVAKWSTPNPDTLLRLSQILNTTAGYLVGQTDSKSCLPEGASFSDDDIKFALFRGDKDISDEAYKEVMAFADFVRQKYKRET